MPTVYENEIISFRRDRPDDPASWLSIEIKDKEGKTRTRKIKDKSAIESIERGGLGSYLLGHAKTDKTYNGKPVYDIVSASKVGSSANNSNPNDHGEQNKQDLNKQKKFSNDVMLQNRYISNQSCVKAAADIIKSAIEQGAFKLTNIIKNDKGTTDFSYSFDMPGLLEASRELAAIFISEIDSDIKRLIGDNDEEIKL